MSVILGGLAGSSQRLAAGIGVLGVGSLSFQSDVAPQEMMRGRGLSSLTQRAGQFVKFLAGVTKDSAGTPLASCTLSTFRSATETLVDQRVSDAVGAYAVPVYDDAFYQIDAYKVGAPDVAGTTRNDLKGA
jgi:hypothetical protein